MSTTVMPGFTPAKARTSAGLSRASRSRSAAVRSGFAIGGFDGVGVGGERRAAARASRAAEQAVFSWGSPWRALCESRRATQEPHPSRRVLILANRRQFSGRLPCAIPSDSSRLTLLLATACTAFGAGGGRHALERRCRTCRRAPERRRSRRAPATTPACARSRRPTSSALMRRVRPTNASRPRLRAQGRAGLRQRAEEIRACHRAAAVDARGLELPRLYATASSATTTPRSRPTTARSRSSPDIAEAIEYRGHAYLGLNRLSEAKEAYLALYRRQSQARGAAARRHAGLGRRASRQCRGVDGPTLESFASWVSERSTIAGQTAGLTREGASCRLVGIELRAPRAPRLPSLAPACSRGVRVRRTRGDAVRAGNCRADFPSPRCRPTIR